MLPRSRRDALAKDADSMVYIRRTFTWTFTGMTLVVGILWLFCWSIWHTKQKRSITPSPSDNSIESAA